jgi:imidazolonepropionase-like amidohydrolase
MPVPLTRDIVESLAETLPANQIQAMRATIMQRETNGNPPDELFELHCRNLRKIHDAGMVIGLGTDGTGDGIGVHQQLAAYTRCGMTTMEAIVAATGTNANILKLDRMGTVAAMNDADFVVLDANPLDNIANALRISAVYLRGRQVDRTALRAKFMMAGKK